MSIRDALINNGTAGIRVVKLADRREKYRQTKAEKEAAAKATDRETMISRIRTIKQLAHDVLVTERVQSHRPVRFDIYNEAKPELRQIAVEGGEEYSEMIAALKYASVSRVAFDEIVSRLSPSEHSFADYESSDAVVRY